MHIIRNILHPIIIIVIAEIIIIASLYVASPVIKYSNKNTFLKKLKNFIIQSFSEGTPNRHNIAN